MIKKPYIFRVCQKEECDGSWNYLGHLDLVILLKVFSVSSDEVLGGNVLDGEASSVTVGKHDDTFFECVVYVSREKNLKNKISLYLICGG